MKKNRDHVVPLTDQTIALLEALKPYSGHREYIFPSDRDPKKPTNPQTANMALKRMGYGGQLVAHGLRSIASTTLNEQGYDPDVIEAALAHVDSNEVRRAYNRSDYLEKRKILMDSWSKHIETAAVGNLGIATSNNVLAGNFT
jgi:integrase